jgi:hypothetical protein
MLKKVQKQKTRASDGKFAIIASRLRKFFLALNFSHEH